MEDTKIRWTGSTWNPMTGCTEVSPGCDHCYARVIAEKFAGRAFPAGFAARYIPERLGLVEKWPAQRVFVNSMSDLHHRAFGEAEVESVYDQMARVDKHEYQVLTKRPERMRAFVRGWLERRGVREVPGHIWLGASIESDRYVYRADVLRDIPVPVRFISAEPLLGPLPSLDLAGIAWLIVGGESGKGFRPMDHAWAHELLGKARAAGTAFYFKQSAAAVTERGMELDGKRYEEMPRYKRDQRGRIARAQT